MPYVASGRNIFRVEDSSPQKAPSMPLIKGKGGVYLPQAMQNTLSCSSIEAMAMRSEIQSVTISPMDASSGDSWMLVTDCHGRGLYAKVPGDAALAKEGIDIRSIEALEPQDNGGYPAEAGWTGGALSAGCKGVVAAARHFPRDVTLFDRGIVTEQFHTLYAPNDVLFLSSDLSMDGDRTPLVAVAEGPCVCVWDTRQSERNSVVSRISAGPYAGRVLTISASSSKSSCTVFGAAGEDRTVGVWDPRMWKSIDRWSNCLKYEVTSLHFMSSDPSLCLVSGLDYEVVCGSWFNNNSKAVQASLAKKARGRAAGPVSDFGSEAEANKKNRVSSSFRGNSRWIGMGKSPSRDVFVGMTVDKTLYQAEFSPIG